MKDKIASHINDSFLDMVGYEYSIWALNDIAQKAGFEKFDYKTKCYPNEQTPSVFVMLQEIIRVKRAQRESVHQELGALAAVKIHMREYCATLAIDEQIELIKYVQPD